ncbi:MAG: lipocalin family protein [Alphaproteobacteria bacterium]
MNERGQYSWAVVGEPRRKFGWLLSRTKTVSPQTLASAKTILQRAGYDLSKFRKTKQF